MNEEQKDKGLKRAVKAENEFRLPSNFAYRTMRKVEEAMRLREKKSERTYQRILRTELYI